MTEVIEVEVAIVGGGPAGLAAAIELRRKGISHVTVFEREAEAGGIPRHCAHSPYGLREFRRLLTGPAYARRLCKLASDSGVEILTRHSVVSLEPNGVLRVASPERLLEVRARRVILATGARETPRSARMISGQRPVGVMNTGALQGSVYLQALRPFRRPVVVGTELVSLSALWTCVSNGIRPVAVIEAGPNPTARWPLTLFPRLLRIPVHFQSQLTQIRGASRVDGVEITSGSGERIQLECDGVLLAGQFIPEAALVRMSAIAMDAGSGGPSVDQFGRSSDASYFVAGNALRPVETAGWCYREGRRIAACVALDLAGYLPKCSSTVRIVCGPGVKYSVPQSICLPAGSGGMPALQIRCTTSGRGRLTVRHGNQILWSRHQTFRPERRISIALSELQMPPAASSIEIAIEGQH